MDKKNFCKIEKNECICSASNLKEFVNCNFFKSLEVDKKCFYCSEGSCCNSAARDMAMAEEGSNEQA